MGLLEAGNINTTGADPRFSDDILKIEPGTTTSVLFAYQYYFKQLLSIRQRRMEGWLNPWLSTTCQIAKRLFCTYALIMTNFCSAFFFLFLSLFLETL